MESENQTDHEVVAIAVNKWKKLVRQQSSKLFTFADNVVSPMDERISNQISELKTENIQLTEGSHNTIMRRRTSKSLADLVFRLETVEDTINEREHFPKFMPIISVIQVILYSVFDQTWLTQILGYDPHRRHEIWRLFTALLVQPDAVHMCGNLVMQLILGVFLEIVHRWKRIAIIYSVSGLGGSLYSSVWEKNEYAMGASSGAMGLLFSHLATIILNWKGMDYKFSRIFCVLLYSAFSLYSFKGSKVIYIGHIGGAVTGFLVSIIVLKHSRKISWNTTLRVTCALILSITCNIICMINVIGSDYLPTEWNFDYNRTFQEHEAKGSNRTFPVTVFRKWLG